MANDAWGIGASLLRREDERHLHGRGEFVSDIKLPGTMEVAFLRSPHAHARIRGITAPPEGKGRVFTAADLPRIQPIRVVTQAAGAKAPAWPPLATDKVRYVGEAIAACIAPSRAEAEDLAAAVSVDFEALDAVVDAPRDMRGSRHPVHEQWGDNLYSERVFEGGDIDAAARAAEITVTREYRMHRQSGASARRPRRARLSRPPARRGRGLRLDADAAYRARCLGRDSRRRTASHPRRRTRCRRRFRAKGAALPGRDHPRRIGARTRSSGALGRGPRRASPDLGAYPRPSLQGHRLCRPAGPHSRRRCRDRRRCRRLRAVAAGAVPGGGDGGAQPAGALRDPELSRAGRHRRDQQGAARPLSRGRPAGGVLCDRADDRRGRPCGRPRPGRGAGAEHGAAGADAVHHYRRHALRQWRLSAQREAMRRAIGPAGDSRAATAGRDGRPPRRHRLCRVCRADRARRRRVRRPRRGDRPGL